MKKRPYKKMHGHNKLFLASGIWQWQWQRQRNAHDWAGKIVNCTYILKLFENIKRESSLQICSYKLPNENFRSSPFHPVP